VGDKSYACMLFVTVIGNIKVKTSPAATTAENFHVKQEIQDRIPHAALGVAHVQRKTFRASHVTGAGGSLRGVFGHCVAYQCSRNGSRLSHSSPYRAKARVLA